MYNKLMNNISRPAMAVLLAAVLCTGCEPDSSDIDDPKNPEKAGNFIPARNKKFIYKVESDGGTTGTVTQNISGSKDSSGIAVYNLHAVVQFKDSSLTMDNKIFTLNGKTYTEIKVPDAWYKYVELFGKMPNIKVTKAAVSGYPAYLIMQNALKEGSVITVDGPLAQEQLIEYTNNGKFGSSRQEIGQAPGSGTVETIKVPAGSFVCNKFSYEVITKITSKVESKEETANGSEKITVWMAHGVGMVKQESAATLVSMIPLPTGEIKKIVTNTASTTTLQKIE
ncbi:hypothetical protein LQ567_10885 [Niabella pedocola]|uniref:DUF3108 domain-containing protein n=1 Tax=Niabella pedocola TaxID=1752077 RepID=A0ABS8PQ85_9BACT|nr:hypothetical protein [Niabella pedocola]MCD2423266.1 hypothetical protein [Niabella pedocola]